MEAWNPYGSAPDANSIYPCPNSARVRTAGTVFTPTAKRVSATTPSGGVGAVPSNPCQFEIVSSVARNSSPRCARTSTAPRIANSANDGSDFTSAPGAHVGSAEQASTTGGAMLCSAPIGARSGHCAASDRISGARRFSRTSTASHSKTMSSCSMPKVGGALSAAPRRSEGSVSEWR